MKLTIDEIRSDRRAARKEAREAKVQRDIRERYVLKDAIKERDDKIVALEQELASLKALHARVMGGPHVCQCSDCAKLCQ